MTRRMIMLGAVMTLSASAQGAGPDGNIEWAGVSHIAFQDRLPRCPVGGESFTVRFQSFRNDLTAARVRVDDGAVVFAVAGVVASRGPYDVWEATVPATASSVTSYVIELTDGADVDYYDANGMSEVLAVDGSGNPTAPFVLDFVTLAHAPVGGTLVTGGAVFKVWSPTTTSCHVRGTFNSWLLRDPLTRVGEHFIGFVAGAVAGDQYKFFFDDRLNNVWNSDPRARRLNPTDNLNSFLVDTESYQWQVASFAPPALEDMVVYQLHVGSFAGLNDPMGPTSNPSGYRDVGDRAAHLAELGVNAVMLNPITEFPGDFSGGYNPITQYGPEWRLGPPDDLKYMVDQLHANGIAVILDIVWNHFSPTDNYLWNFDGTQLYFNVPNIDTPWGSQADFDKQGVRDYFLDSVVLWLDEYRMDGFRMDATSFMANQQPSGWSLMQEMNDLIDNRYADKVAIAEQLPDDSFITRPVAQGGAGFDAQYFDWFTDTLRAEIFNAAFGDPSMAAIRNIINGGGTFLSGSRVLNYFELHDEAWVLSGGQRAVVTIDPTAPHDDEFARSRTMLAQGIVQLAPGVPAMLMGTEWLESNGFEQQRLDWSKKTIYADVFAYYRALMGLRVGNTALGASSPHQVFHVNETGNVIAWQRFDLNGLVYVVVANFANVDYPLYRIGAPQAGTWGEVLNSQDAAFGGTGTTNPALLQTTGVRADGFSQSVEISLARRALVVLQFDPPIVICTGDANGDGIVDFDDIVTALGNWQSAGPLGDADGNGIVNFDDVLAVLANWLVVCP